MAEKRELTIATDFDLDEHRVRRAEAAAMWPENELRLKRLDVALKLESLKSLDQLEIVNQLIDTLNTDGVHEDNSHA